MPDISKCQNEECTLKETCYRYTCEPSPLWQTYGAFEQDEEGECDYYWENEKKISNLAKN